MNRKAIRSLALAAAALGVLGAWGPRAAAAELYTYTFSAMAGLGGSVDAEPGDDLANGTLQLGFSYITEPRTRVGVRVGNLGLADGDQYNRLVDAELTYATVAGEYKFSEPYYDSWMWLGLGAYRLEGDPLLPGADDSSTALGGVIGVTGEFRFNRHWDFIVELSGHWADFEDSQVFGLGLAGVSFHF